jgi:nucleoside-diphosphate-sugar epimerase
MRILVTGAEGFIGRALVAALGDGHELRRTDRSDGDIADPAHVGTLFDRPVDRLFHLAGIASGATEADFVAGRRANVESTTLLLRHCRVQVERGGVVPRFVYASSIAVFGVPLPARIDDSTVPAPSLSYGTQKRTSELLVDDATRRGDVDGRSLRLAGVVVRPAAPNGALSGFNSDLIREPLAGRDYVCPVEPQATFWITSLEVAVDNLLRLADADASRLGADRALTAPALAVSAADVAAAIGRVDPAAAARIRYEPQAHIAAQFGQWPRACSFDRAEALGLRRDESIDALVRSYHESPHA